LEKLVEIVGKCSEDKGLLWNIESKELKTLQFRETRFNMMTKLPDKDKLELELSSIPMIEKWLKADLEKFDASIKEELLVLVLKRFKKLSSRFTQRALRK
jgi:hypothetical protein